MNIEIVGIGAATSVGSNANLCAASVRAGLARNRLHDLTSGLTCHVADLPRDQEDTMIDTASRSRDMLTRVLVESAERLGIAASVHVYLAAPPRIQVTELLPPGTRIGSLRCEQVTRVEDEAGLAGLQFAIAALRAGECEFACIAGVDVRTDEAALAELEQHGLLLTEESPWGFIPGEGAGVVLLCTDRTRRELKLRSLAEISAFGTATEIAVERGTACIGEALSRVCHEVLSSLPSEETVGEVYSDLNGERSRASEWGFTLSRISKRCRDAVAVCMPGLLWGDVGYANGALLLQLAACQLGQGHTRGSRALVWTAGRGVARSAVLLSGSDEAVIRPLKMPASFSPMQPAHDASILDELLSEAGFLFEQRRRAIHQRNEVPEAGLLIQERLEQRLDHHVQALSLCGGSIVDRFSDSCDIIGATYVTALLATTSGKPEQLRAIVQSSVSPEGRAELYSAISHASNTSLASFAEELLQSPEPSAWSIGLHLAAELNVAPSRPWRELALGGGPRVLGDSFPHALLRLGSANEAPLLDPWLVSENAPTRQLAGLAYMALDKSAARDRFVELADPLLLPLLALSCEPDNQSFLLRACERAREAPSSALALGLLGTTAAIAQLIDRLTDAALSRPSVCALYLATGAQMLDDQEELIVASDDDLTTPELDARNAGDQSVGVERRRRSTFSSDIAVWRAVYDNHRTRFGPTARSRLGQPVDKSTIRALLLDQYLAPNVQRLCAYSDTQGPSRARWLPYDFRVKDLRRLATS